MLRKMVYAGTQASSFYQAEEDIKHLGEVEISRQRIMRATKRIGSERVAQRDTQVEQWQRLPLPKQQASPTAQAPPVACVEMDGGRIQIRDRPGGAEPPAAADGPPRKGRFWRETKVGCLLSMASRSWAEDPCPKIPAVFVDPRRMGEICREIKGFSASEPPPEDESPTPLELRGGRPEVLLKTVVATRRDVHAFGRQLAAAAWQRGFAAACRKAFVADGLAANWTVWQKYFSHYTPILDFVHAISYVYAAAMAARPFAEGWAVYGQWAQWVWEGNVQQVIAQLQMRQAELGSPKDEEPEHSPRKIVADSLRYLKNQQSRMRYHEYRRQGLPITSSHIESTIKQINRRVKGSEKFWSTGGAEALLQLAADYLCQTRPLTRFWKARAARAAAHQRYHLAI